MVDLLNHGPQIGQLMVAFIKIIFFLSILSFLGSCGNTKHSYPGDTSKFSKFHHLSLGSEESTIASRQLESLNNHPSLLENSSKYLDLDLDNVSDAYDDDIDGDGVSNLIDQYPFDASQGMSDHDFDGIPDFVDFDNNELYIKFSNFQADFFSQHKIVLGILDNHWEEEKILEFILTLKLSEKLINETELQVILLAPFNNSRNAEFDENWNSILVYFNENHQDSKLTRTSFTHEAFHALAARIYDLHPQIEELIPLKYQNDGDLLYQQGEFFFKDHAMNFLFDYKDIASTFKELPPTYYALSSPDEYMAEVGTLSYIEHYKITELYNMKRFINKKIHLESKLHQEFIDYFKSL